MRRGPSPETAPAIPAAYQHQYNKRFDPKGLELDRLLMNNGADVNGLCVPPTFAQVERWSEVGVNFVCKDFYLDQPSVEVRSPEDDECIRLKHSIMIIGGDRPVSKPAAHYEGVSLFGKETASAGPALVLLMVRWAKKRWRLSAGLFLGLSCSPREHAATGLQVAYESAA